jgi:hypothetical protein
MFSKNTAHTTKSVKSLSKDIFTSAMNNKYVNIGNIQRGLLPGEFLTHTEFFLKLPLINVKVRLTHFLSAKVIKKVPCLLLLGDV